MKTSSQKPTDCVSSRQTSPREQFANPKSSLWETKETCLNRFTGLSKDLERVPSLHIPGYKSRG